jgi:[ribosomal protein S5]-alanine N-acetyltransferase
MQLIESMESIITPRLLLRSARTGDLDAMHEILSDPKAMRYWDRLPHTDLGQTRAWLASMTDASLDDSYDFIMEHAGTVVGRAGLWRMPEIGFIVNPKYWGQGFAFEALSAIIPPAFSKFGIDSIIADVDPRNDASLRLLKRLKFDETRRAQRTIKVGDEWCDSVYLKLIRSNA